MLCAMATEPKATLAAETEPLSAGEVVHEEDPELTKFLQDDDDDDDSLSEYIKSAVRMPLRCDINRSTLHQ